MHRVHGAAARLHPARVRARWALRRVRDGAVGSGAAVPAVPAGVRGHHAHRRAGGAPHGARPSIKQARATTAAPDFASPPCAPSPATASDCTAPQARVEPVHYLLCEAGPGQAAAAERVRDVTVGSAVGRDAAAAAASAAAWEAPISPASASSS